MARKSTKNTSVNDETINEQIVEESTENVITPEEIEDACEAPEGIEDGTIIETNVEEEPTEDTIGEEIGNIFAEENNKKFEEVKRKHLTNQMIGFLWNGQEMDW